MPDKTMTPDAANEVKQAAESWLADVGYCVIAKVIDVSLVQGLVSELGQRQDALDLAGQALNAYNDIALDATGIRETLVEGEPVDWQGVWESVGDLGARLRKAEARAAKLQEQRDTFIRIGERDSELIGRIVTAMGGDPEDVGEWPAVVNRAVAALKAGAGRG